MSNKSNKMAIGFIALLLLVVVGAEVSAGGYISSYSVLRGIETETTGAYLTSIYWGALTAGRLASVPLSMRLHPRSILFINYIGTHTISLQVSCRAGCIFALIVLLTLLNSRVALWLGFMLFGFFGSS